MAAATGGRWCEARNFKVGGSICGARREASPGLLFGAQPDSIKFNVKTTNCLKFMNGPLSHW